MWSRRVGGCRQALGKTASLWSRNPVRPGLSPGLSCTEVFPEGQRGRHLHKETAGLAVPFEVTYATFTPVQLKPVEQAFMSLAQTTVEQRQAGYRAQTPEPECLRSNPAPTDSLRDPGPVT